MSGDAEITNTGAITITDDAITTDKILNDAVTADKLADSINTLISNNTAKTGITTQQAADIVTNLSKTGITAQQISDITDNNDKVTNATHSGDVTDASGVLTLVADKVITSTILDANVTTAKIANDAVDYDKLGTEFTTSAAISALDVDFSSAAVFTKALSGTTTLTFSNVETGMVKTLVISGNQSLVLPSGVTILNGTYSGTATTNVIQIVSTNGSTQMFATVSNV